jgi:hypothetical protein
LLKKVGFEKKELVGETGFNSSPKTKGVLFRAEKPTNLLKSLVIASVVLKTQKADDAWPMFTGW